MHLAVYMFYCLRTAVSNIENVEVLAKIGLAPIYMIVSHFKLLSAFKITHEYYYKKRFKYNIDKFAFFNIEN